MFFVTERQPQEKNLVVSFQLLQQIYKTQCWLVCRSLHWFVGCQFNRCMQIFSNVIVHSKGFNGSRACKPLKKFYQDHYIKRRLLTMKDYIPNQVNLKTELVLQKTSTAHVEECPGISKFIKLFQMFFSNLLNQLKSHQPNQRLIE